MGVQLVFGRGILVVKNDEAVRETLGIDENYLVSPEEFQPRTYR